MQNTSLPFDLSLLLKQADTAFVHDNEEQAKTLIEHIENECERLQTPIYADEFMS
jgi:hypothetical protein